MPDIKKVRNWKDYNMSLKKRGSVIFSFSGEYLEELYFTGKRAKGGKRQYSHRMYELILYVKVLFRLPWRGAIGFTEKLLEKLLPNQVVTVPNFGHASRECGKLELKVKQYNLKKTDMEIAFDSTGVNVYTTSGWHIRKHGKDSNKCHKRDQWKKIHIGIDIGSGQALVSEVTRSNVNDCEVFETMSNDITGTVSSVRADGAYDTYEIYKKIDEWGAKAIIPPATTSKAQDELKKQPKEHQSYLKQRDETIHKIREYGSFEEGLKQWKKESGYHRRSLVEAFMFRFKRTFGFYLHNKTDNNRKNEINAKLNLLNFMTSLGMAKYC